MLTLYGIFMHFKSTFYYLLETYIVYNLWMKVKILYGEISSES